MPKFPKKKLAQLLLQACVHHGVEQVVISPGSRNAPLTLGFVNHPEMNTYSVVDERCAGFFALGLAQQTGKTVALLCTSGSALLNYYPAVAEAYYSKIPLDFGNELKFNEIQLLIESRLYQFRRCLQRHTKIAIS